MVPMYVTLGNKFEALFGHETSGPKWGYIYTYNGSNVMFMFRRKEGNPI